MPRHRRRIGYVFQEGRLFPHLTVRQNLLYGRWFAPHAERRDDLDRVVDLLGIGALLERRPARLSGGEKQRVAIGRALLASPRLLLMDEPLASLDEARKAEILPYIERLRDQSQRPDRLRQPFDRRGGAAGLHRRAPVRGQGRGGRRRPEIMHRLDLFPLTGRAEAGAVIEATVERHDERFGLTELRSRAGLWKLPRLDAPVGTRLRLRVRARDVMLARVAPADSERAQCLARRGRRHRRRRGSDRRHPPRLQRRGADRASDALFGGAARPRARRAGLCLVKSVALDRRSLSGPIPPGPARTPTPTTIEATPLALAEHSQRSQPFDIACRVARFLQHLAGMLPNSIGARRGATLVSPSR